LIINAYLAILYIANIKKLFRRVCKGKEQELSSTDYADYTDYTD